MKRHLMIVVALTMTMLFGVWTAVPAQAQQETVDTILARSAAKGFLATLVRPGLTSTRDFYLLDTVNATGVVNELGQVTSYEIVAADWADAASYKVEATVQPSGRSVIIFSGKYEGRWRVEGLKLAAPEVSSVSTTNGNQASGLQPVSGNGNGVLIIQSQSGGDFYRINANGTGLQRLSHGIDPQISPDGSKVAFTRWEPRYELFTINIDGSNEQAVGSGFRQIKSPTWSADGQSLTFSYQDGGRLNEDFRRVDLLKAALDDDAVDIPEGARDLDVDGTILKYRLPADAFWHLKKINLSSGEMIDLITERHSYGPSGHPTDSNLVAYKGINGVSINNSVTSTDQPISRDWRDHTPVISPDGSQVVVSYQQDGHWEVHTMNLDGSNRQRLTTTPLRVIVNNNSLRQAEVDGKLRVVANENPWWNNAAPTWSPDGSQIAFMTDRTGQWEIWIMGADGTNQRPMFPNGALDGITLNYAGVDERMLSWN